MHAVIENNVITAIRTTPSGGAWEDDQWLDFTDPTVLSEWEKRHGWVPVVETPRPDDTDTTKHDEKVVVPSTAISPVPLGLIYEPTPMTPAPSGTILDGGTL